MTEGILIEIVKQGIVGVIAVLFIIFYRKERKNVSIVENEKTEIAKSFNKQIALLNEKRGEEIRLMAEALQADSDNNMRLSQSVEKLRDFLMQHVINRSGE